MSTDTKYTLTSTPVQITDGTKAAYISVFKGAGEFRVASSASKANGYHSERKLSTGPGFALWAWNDTGNALEIVVTVEG